MIDSGNEIVSSATNHSISMLISMAAGVCLLLWGSFTVRNAVERVFSNSLSGMLSASADSKIRTVLIGIVSALFLQSATATILLATGLLNSGVMSIYAAMGIVLGADLGSAIAARILFLDFSLLHSVLIVAGMVTFLVAGTTRLKMYGRIAIGVGLMLLSLQLIKLSVAPIAGGSSSTVWILIFQSAPLVSVVFVALATWFAHSSVAAILIIAVLAQTGLLDADVYIPMLIGANIGAGLIAVPLVYKSSLEARSVVISNFALRTLLGICALLTAGFWVTWIPFSSLGPGESVIYLHLAFNAILVLFASPLIGSIADFVLRKLTVLDAEPEGLSILTAGSGLDEDHVDKPKSALSNAKREAFRLGDITESYLVRSLDMFKATDESEIDSVVSLDDEINMRNRALHAYLSRVRQSISDTDQEATLDEILHFSSSMENIGDTISHSLSRLARKRLRRGVRLSREGEAEIIAAHGELLKLLRLVLNQFAEGNQGYEKQIQKSARKVKRIYAHSLASHRQRLSEKRSRSLSSSSIHQDMLRELLTITFLLEFLSYEE